MSLATLKREKGDEHRMRTQDEHRKREKGDGTGKSPHAYARLNDWPTVLHHAKATGNVCGCVKDSGVPVPGMDVRLCGGQSLSAVLILYHSTPLSGFCFSLLNFRTGLKISCNNQLPERIRNIFHLIFLTYERLIEI